MSSLKSRIENYQSIVDYKLTPKLPLIITINGRSSNKLTSLIDKPFSLGFSECIYATCYKLCLEVEGVVFGYVHNDEIVLIVKNDQNLDTKPWYLNSIQKIVSTTSAIASLHFNKVAKDIGLNITSDFIFISSIFPVPTDTEAINTLIYKQQYNFATSLDFACFYELLNKNFDKQNIKEMLYGLSADEKIELLKQECDIDFHCYPIEFRRGIACYRVPISINDTIKYKWFINNNLPIFTKDQNFLNNIIKND